MSDTRNQHSDSSPLHDLEGNADFISRHIGPRDHDIEKMLAEIGAASLDELIASTLPPSIQSESPLDLPDAIPALR